MCYNVFMSKMKKEIKTKLLKILIIVVALTLLVLAIYLPLKLTGTIDKIDSAEKLKEVILEWGAYSYIIFIIIQFLQVTFLPLPAVVTTVAGTLVFGPWITFGLSLLAVMLGSIFAFFLGRKIGRKLVVWVAGEKDAKKWEEKLSRGKYVYFLMMLFPVFPDDILCIVAGCIGMKWKFFLITNIITRPISIGATCIFGSGQLIPFSGWGIPVWIVLIILACVVFFLSVKYQPQIENFITNLASKIGKKKNVSKDDSNLTAIETKCEDNKRQEQEDKSHTSENIDNNIEVQNNDTTLEDVNINNNDKKDSESKQGDFETDKNAVLSEQNNEKTQNNEEIIENNNNNNNKQN